MDGRWGQAGCRGGVPTLECEGVVTPYERGAVGVVWAEESPEVGALPDGTD